MSDNRSTTGRGPPGGSGQDSPRAAPKSGSPGGGSAKATVPQKGQSDQSGRKTLTETELIGKRIDLPAEAFAKEGQEESRFTPRPGYNTEGKPVQVQLNLFPVASWADLEIYQYDISVFPNHKASIALVKKVWNTQTVIEALRTKGGKWLYDGNKLAWSSEKIDRNEARIVVNLDYLKHKEAQNKEIYKKATDNNSVYYLTIRQTTTIRLSYLKRYLQGSIGWDSHVLECMNFFDHCMRQYPSEKLMRIRRSFFDPNHPKEQCGEDLVLSQGIYSAARLGELMEFISKAINRGGTGISINVDRCSTAFWPELRLDELCCRILQAHKEEWYRDIRKPNQLQFHLKPVEKVNEKTGKAEWAETEAFQFLRRIVKLRFVVNHRGKIGHPKVYSVDSLIFDKKYGRDGGNANQVTFEKKMPDGSTKITSIFDHYKEHWGIRLEFPFLPIVKTTRGGLYPLELCNSIPHQRYPFKLNPAQTRDMIKKSASKPSQRRRDIMQGIQELDWPNDPYLKAFGIKISPQMTITQARLLQNPEITFGNQTVNPGVSGRWDLRGKTFLEPNFSPLSSWGIFCVGDACRRNELENFARQFSECYRNHGGRVGRPAYFDVLPYGTGDHAQITKLAFDSTEKHCKSRPQIIFFILSTKNQLNYERIKKSMDCRWNVVSQCIDGKQVPKCSGQYLSNVAIKVNSKLGGVTCRVPSRPNGGPPFWERPTAIIGLDVSHSGSGSSSPSMAALTMSMDKHATRYSATCQTNGYREELISPPNMQGMLHKLARHWIGINGCVPMHIYFIRDGVSEGQFQDVIDKELAEMRRVFRDLKCSPKFTVIIATKRHHVRFFPRQGDKTAGDRNGNPLPGTLVERDVTHPKHFDFYLCSHAAIQGTSRPVHYQVILDEANVKPNDLQKMIYQQCYQYCRSTTPVSLHPAVYYSHLASNRARSHEGIPFSNKILGYAKPGFPYAKGDDEIYNEDYNRKMAPPLVAMRGEDAPPEAVRFINTTMWYV
ncbi:Protein argonaute [Parahypoxylon ruwenzoriense]